MKSYRPYFWIIAMLLLACSNATFAQSRREQVKAHIDSVLTERYYKTPYDTNFVVRPEGRLTLKLRLNQSGDDFHAKGDKDGISYKADLHTTHKTTVSIGGSYRGISAALAINPAKLKGAYDDYEFNLSYFSSRLSVDGSYHRSTTLSGDLERGDYSGHLAQDGVMLKMANLAGYYVFNHRVSPIPPPSPKATSSAVRLAHGSRASVTRAGASRPPTSSKSGRPMPPKSKSTSDSSASVAATATTGCSARNGCSTSPCSPPSSSTTTTT